MVTIVNTFKGEVCLVVVPDDAVIIIVNKALQYSFDYDSTDDTYDFTVVKLPEGNWQFIALHKDMTEEQAKELVDDYHMHPPRCRKLYKNYTFQTDLIAPFDTALESLTSLVASKGLAGKNVVILRRTE